MLKSDEMTSELSASCIEQVIIKNKIHLCLITWVEGKEEMADIGPVVECETPCMQFYSQELSY